MAPLILWQNIPSIHQAPLIRAVARQWPGEVLVVTEADVSEHRLRQGWERPDFSPARLIVAPTREERRQLVIEYGVMGAVHIFSGLHAYPETYCTLKQVSYTAATIGVFVEPGRTGDGFRAILRRLRYTLHGLHWGRRLDFLLATGELGVRWYRRCGFSERRIYPFGYFVEQQKDERIGREADSWHHDIEESMQLLFVGQIDLNKGLDLLLHSLCRERNQPWWLDVVGDGLQGEQYRTLAETLSLGERVRWLGVRSNQVVRAQMAQADALVLPSRYDGWGAVVNEALMAGMPVIVSDACGASDLVREPWQGKVFQAGSVESLQKALSVVFCKGRLLEAERGRIQAWARDAISPDSAARYLLEIIKHVQYGEVRPVAPWRTVWFHESTTLPAAEIKD